jgi:hypothetical protein
MPLPQQVQQERAERHHAAEALAERDRRRAWLRTIGLCWFWSLLGTWFVLWSTHTTSHAYGLIAFWGGLSLGNGGILFTLIGAWRAAERRGDRA